MDALAFSLTTACLFQALFFIAVISSGSAREALWGRLLVALLAALALDKADQFYLMSGLVQGAPQWALIGSVFGAAVPGLLYLHLRARIQPERDLRWRDGLVLLPFLALTLYAILTFHILPLEEKRRLFETRAILNTGNRLIIPLIGDAVILGFLIASLSLIHRHDRRLLDWFSNVEHRRLVDVQTVLIIMGVLVVIHVFWTLTGASGFGAALGVGHLLLINVLGLSALTSKPALPQSSPPAVEEPDPDLLAVWSRVERALSDQALYLDPDLTVAKLAGACGERPRQVSQAINRYSGGTFYDLVNRRRVQAAQARLIAEPELNVLAIALDCGFNSKSAFNAAFKRIVGATPSAWRVRRRS